jgi:hypothetical protein
MTALNIVKTICILCNKRSDWHETRPCGGPHYTFRFSFAVLWADFACVWRCGWTDTWSVMPCTPCVCITCLTYLREQPIQDDSTPPTLLYYVGDNYTIHCINHIQSNLRPICERTVPSDSADILRRVFTNKQNLNGTDATVRGLCQRRSNSDRSMRSYLSAR